MQRLIAAGKTYEADGALWLRTTEYGDDKDRVMRKSDAADGAAQRATPTSCPTSPITSTSTSAASRRRSTSRAATTTARSRACAPALQAAGVGIPAGYPDYVLHKMVTVMRGGEEVKISKRSGSYVTLRDLIDWTSSDAVRFFLISRKADTEFVFDVDLALKQSDENPVFYVQYAHARICSVLAAVRGPARRRPRPTAALAGADLSLLVAPSEAALMRQLAEYPPMLAGAAAGFAPHDVAFYLRDLAAAFHSYYAAERFLVDDPELTRARLALLRRDAPGARAMRSPARRQRPRTACPERPTDDDC